MKLERLAMCLVLAGSQAWSAPVITSFSPVAGTTGDQVSLTGSGFSAGGITVRFWNGGSGVVAPIVFLNSDTVITVAVPAGITTGPISIQQGTGAQSFTADDFLAIGLGPYITGFSPLYGAVNDTVVITGAHLTNATGVKFNGTNALEFLPNANGMQITTRVPPGATSGPLTVSTLYGTSNTTASFTVVGPGPYITDFSPISGDSGTKVLIDGLHFTGVTNVTFNGRPGVILSATSDTLLQVAAPAGLTTGPIVVQTTVGNFATSSNFFGKPTVTGFAPVFGRANTNVVLSGTNLLGATGVSFGGMAAGGFSATNNSTLVVAVPSGALSGLIRVGVPGASAFSPSNFIVRPTLSGFAPAFGPVGTAVTLSGANFNAGTPVVRFTGVAAATPTGITFSQMTVVVPAGAGTGPISVTTADGSDTNTALFYLPATITSFAPTNAAPGTRVMISGRNLTGTTAVTFNGTAATAFVISNDTTINATVPGNVITGPIAVTTPAGVAPSSAVFYGAPQIASFTPTHGLPGTNVTINGVNFLGGAVQFGGLKAATVSLNNTQIVATVPSGAQTGPISVLGPAGTNVSAGNFTLDYMSNLQVSITNSPNPVLVGDTLTYTIVIFNAGPLPAPSAGFTNIFSGNATLQAASITGLWQLTTNGNVVTGSLASYDNGNSATLSVSVVPHGAGALTNTIWVGSANPDPVPADNKASLVTVVEAGPSLAIGLVGPGVQISWPARLTNYALQFEDGLGTSPQWSAVSNAPVVSGALQFVQETNRVPARFYRLKR